MSTKTAKPINATQQIILELKVPQISKDCEQFSSQLPFSLLCTLSELAFAILNKYVLASNLRVFPFMLFSMHFHVHFIFIGKVFLITAIKEQLTNIFPILFMILGAMLM